MSFQAGFFISREIEEILLCPVCRTTVMPPPRMCRRGHIICRSCFRRLTQCPVCRGSLSKRNNLAITMITRLVRLPCSYSVNGCQAFPMRAIARKWHEIYCSYRPLVCAFPSCVWEETFPTSGGPALTSVSALESHLRRCHSSHVMFIGCSVVSVNVSLSEDFKLTSRIKRYILLLDGEIFLAAVETRSKKGGTIRAGMARLARPVRSDLAYRSTIEVNGGEYAVNYKLPVVSYMLVWPGQICKSLGKPYSCSIQLKQLQRYSLPDGEIAIKLSVQNNDTA